MCASSGAPDSKRSPVACAPKVGCEECSATAASSGAIVSGATIPDAPTVGFTATQAARLSNCTVAQLRYWSRSGLVTPGSARGGYGFRDLVALRIVRSMLDAGLPSARVRIALDAVRDAGHDLSSLRLITDGRHVWACHDDGQ